MDEIREFTCVSELVEAYKIAINEFCEIQPWKEFTDDDVREICLRRATREKMRLVYCIDAPAWVVVGFGYAIDKNGEKS